MEHKFKELQKKLESLSPNIEDHQPQQKTKMRALQNAISKLQARFEQENIQHQHKAGLMIEHIRKLEHSLKDTHN